MNRDIITIQDCIENYEMRGRGAELNDGRVIGFVPEGNPADTAWLEPADMTA